MTKYLTVVFISLCLFFSNYVSHANSDTQEIEALKKQIEEIQLESQRQIYQFSISAYSLKTLVGTCSPTPNIFIKMTTTDPLLGSYITRDV